MVTPKEPHQVLSSSKDPFMAEAGMAKASRAPQGYCFIHISTPNLMKTLHNGHCYLPASKPAAQRSPTGSQGSQSLSVAEVGFSVSTLSHQQPLGPFAEWSKLTFPPFSWTNICGPCAEPLVATKWGRSLTNTEGASNTTSHSLEWWREATWMNNCDSSQSKPSRPDAHLMIPECRS